ncbi:hypothetical protein MAP00_004973 [Monascus purpureus]|nr:hypothetical protein MAP00_004973 [Monascus purpureus]
MGLENRSHLHPAVSSGRFDLQSFSIWILYPILGVWASLLLLFLIQRIRRRRCTRRGGLFHAPVPFLSRKERPMDSESFPEKPPLRTSSDYHDDDPGSGDADQLTKATSDSSSDSRGACTLPPACGILKPLSDSILLPSSGYVAALKGQRSMGEIMHPARFQAQGPSAGRWHVPSEPQEKITVLYSERTSFSCQKVTPPGTQGGRHDSLSESVNNGPNEEGLGEPMASPAALFGQGRPGTATDETGLSSSQPVQIRSQTQQVLRGVDAEGARTWKRLIIEYH